MNKYITEIDIEDVDYVPWDDAPHDVAYVLLNIPKAFLTEYLQLTKQTEKKSPDGFDFWLNTNLRERLRGKVPKRTHEPLEDILDFLGGPINIQFYGDDGNRIRLAVYEVPEIDVE